MSLVATGQVDALPLGGMSQAVLASGWSICLGLYIADAIHQDVTLPLGRMSGRMLHRTRSLSIGSRWPHPPSGMLWAPQLEPEHGFLLNSMRKPITEISKVETTAKSAKHTSASPPHFHPPAVATISPS